jgi:hypothetical protein
MFRQDIGILLHEADHKPFSDLRGPAVGVDPRDEGADTGVDTRVVGTSASLAPRDDTEKLAGRVDDRAARVTLASITSTTRVASAEHGRGDVTAVLAVAGAAGDNGHGDLAEGSNDAAALAGGAPAGDGGGDAGGGVGARGGEADVGDAAAGLDGAGQAPEGDVVAEGAAAVAGVDEDLADADRDTAGGPLLQIEGSC